MKRIKYAFKKANVLVIVGYSIILGNTLWALCMLLSNPQAFTIIGFAITLGISVLVGWFLVWSLSYNMDRDLTREDEEDKIEL